MKGSNSRCLEGGLGDAWTDIMRPMLVSGAGAMLATTVEKASSYEPVRTQLETVATEKAAGSLITWVKENPKKLAIYAGAGVLGLSLTTIILYRAFIRK